MNYSKDEIKSEFFGSEYSMKEYEIDGIETIAIVTERVNLLYLFDAGGVCKICIVVPHSYEDLNYYIETYNNLYVTISETRWRMYNNEGFADIQLIFNNNNKPSFKWTTK